MFAREYPFMKYTKYAFLLFFLFSLNYSYGVELKIGLFSDQKIKSLVVIPTVGSYSVTTNDNIVCDIKSQSSVEIIVLGNGMQLKCNGKVIGSYPKLFLKGKGDINNFKLKVVSPLLAASNYEDNLGIVTSNGVLSLINVVVLDHYVTGVIEAEAGSKQSLEYYKLQAIICRTYALGNLRRHEADDFNLCDKVHCQVYRGVSKSNPDILKAVRETADMVIVDKDLNIIQATFHSNCGGETANAENVWSMPLSYLKSVKDTFCTNQPHANWQKGIKLSDWRNYLAKYNINVPISSNKNALCFEQTERGTDYLFNDKKIPLKNIRDDFNLRSTYFNIKQRNDSILFIGHGFGHGVGLCQEGSMKMAGCGYSYMQILNYYYTDVYLIDLNALQFFKEE